MATQKQTRTEKRPTPLECYMRRDKFARPIPLMHYEGLKGLSDVKQFRRYPFTGDVVQRDGRATPTRSEKKTARSRCPRRSGTW